jgi:hypothetical protein
VVAEPPAPQPLRNFGPPAADILGPIPYTALQAMFDETAPPGMHNYWKSHYLGTLDDGAIDTILQHAASLPVPFSQIHLHQLQGAYDPSNFFRLNQNITPS